MKAFELPDWIDPETWRDYENMRKQIKRPLSDRARNIAVKKLQDLYRQGYSPEDVLEQSIFMCWQGLFEIRQQYATERRATAVDRELRVGAGPVCRRTH